LARRCTFNAETAPDPDAALLFRWITIHLRRCEECQAVYDELRDGVVLDSTTRRIAAGRLLPSIEATWSPANQLRFGPILQTIRDYYQDVALAVQASVVDGTPVDLSPPPPPTQLVDRWLAKAIGILNKGDEYLSFSQPLFWRSLEQSCEAISESEFFRATEAALERGVLIRRIFPLPSSEALSNIANADSSGEHRDIPSDLSYLAFHIELASRFPHYKIRYFISPDEARKHHCSIFISHKRPKHCTAYVPAYRGSKLFGLSFEPSAARIAMDFERLWRREAIDLKLLDTSDDDATGIAIDRSFEGSMRPCDTFAP
jgi:hypothetical protein